MSRENVELSAHRLRALLNDSRCPVGYELRDSLASARAKRLHSRQRVISLPALATFARKHVADYPQLEADIDRLMVEELGAERGPFSDPLTFPRRAIRALTGRTSPKMVAYVIASEASPSRQP